MILHEGVYLVSFLTLLSQLRLSDVLGDDSDNVTFAWDVAFLINNGQILAASFVSSSPLISTSVLPSSTISPLVQPIL